MTIKLSEHLKHVKDIENDYDICRLIILEMPRRIYEYDYYQCGNSLEYKCLMKYYHLKPRDILSYPVCVKIKFDTHSLPKIEAEDYEIYYGEI